MALVTFSFTSSRTIRVAAGASATSFAATPGLIVKAIAWTGGITKGNAIRIKELKSGATVFFDRLNMSYGGRTHFFEEEGLLVAGGVVVSTFPEGEAIIYLK